VLRGEDRLRSAYRRQVELCLASLQRVLGGDADARHRATVALSTLIGALLLARAVDDEALSAEILRDVRNSVKATPLSNGPPAARCILLAGTQASHRSTSMRMEGAPADWFTVRLLLAGNLVVFGISSAHDLGDAVVVLLVLSGALLAVASTRVYLRERAKRKIDR
jgi:hypothetical protein